MSFLLAVTLVSFMQSDAAVITASELAGAWSGTITHDGETTPVALELEPGDDGTVLIKLSAPVIHTLHAPLGRAPFQAQGSDIRLGPFVLTYDRAAGTLAGVIPEGLAPAYKLPFTLRRVERLELPSRPEPAAAAARPAWTFDAGAPLWPGTSFVSGLVYAGAEDGRMHALDAASGKERWRTRVGDKPVVRLPPSDPKSRFDRFGARTLPRRRGRQAGLAFRRRAHARKGVWLHWLRISRRRPRVPGRPRRARLCVSRSSMNGGIIEVRSNGCERSAIHSRVASEGGPRGEHDAVFPPEKRR